MNNTKRHLILAIIWLFGLPAFGVLAVVTGLIPSSQFHSQIISVLWGLGLIAIFGSWAIRDAADHGRSRNFALAFTASWFIVFFLAVFPYLFVTRGARGGAVAALKFLCFVLAVAIAWLAIPTFFGRML